MSTLHQQPTDARGESSPTCGALKPVDGRKAALVCTLPPGHEGPHGFAIGRLQPFVRWGES